MKKQGTAKRADDTPDSVGWIVWVVWFVIALIGAAGIWFYQELAIGSAAACVMQPERDSFGAHRSAIELCETRCPFGHHSDTGRSRSS